MKSLQGMYTKKQEETCNHSLNDIAITSKCKLTDRPLKALRHVHGPPTQSDYVHFSVHNVVPRRLGTRPTVYVRAANLPARVKRSRRCLRSSNTASLHARLPISMLSHQQASSTISGPVPACAHSRIPAASSMGIDRALIAEGVGGPCRSAKHRIFIPTCCSCVDVY